MTEEQIGAAMLALARKEGHSPKMPVNIKQAYIKTPINEQRALTVCDMLKANGEVTMQDIRKALNISDSQASYVLTEVGKSYNLERDRSKGYAVYRIAKEQAA